MDDDGPVDLDRPLLLTEEMRAQPADTARDARRAERLAALQAIVGQMQPLDAGPGPRPTLPPAPKAPDSEAVRTMLQEIVREELAGRTGERITSHLRRLVREEVEQALIRRELDTSR